MSSTKFAGNEFGSSYGSFTFSLLLSGANVLIFEGILAFHDKEVLDLLDMKVFVDTDPDIRLSRRLKRDITIRGRDMKGVLEQYTRHVKPAFDYYIAPSMVIEER